MKRRLKGYSALTALFLCFALLSACGGQASKANQKTQEETQDIKNEFTSILLTEYVPQEVLSPYLQEINTTVSAEYVTCKLLQTFGDSHNLNLMLELTFSGEIPQLNEKNPPLPTLKLYDGVAQDGKTETLREVQADFKIEGYTSGLDPATHTARYAVRLYAEKPLFQEKAATLVLSRFMMSTPEKPLGNQQSVPDLLTLSWERKIDGAKEQKTFIPKGRPTSGIEKFTVSPFFIGVALEGGGTSYEKEKAIVSRLHAVKLIGKDGKEMQFIGDSRTRSQYSPLANGIVLGTLVDVEQLDHIEVDGYAYVVSAG